MKKRGTESVFLRLFLRFGVIVAVVYILLTSVFIQYFRKQQEAEISTMAGYVNNAASSMEQQIQAAINMEQQLFNDSRVAQLAYGSYVDNYDRSQLILELLSTIQSTQSINGLIEEITLSFPGESVELSAQNGYHKRHYTPEMFDGERHQDFSTLYYRDGRPELRLSYPMVQFLEDENTMPDYEVRIILSNQYMDNFVSHLRTENQTDVLWVSIHDDLPVPMEYEGNEELLSKWNARWKRAGYSDGYQTMIHHDHGQYQFVSRHIFKYHIGLVAYQDCRILNQKANGTLLFMSVVLLGMGILFSLLVVWARRSVSSPIYKIMDAFQQVQNGALSVRIYHEKKDEFGYIYDSFNQMVNRIEELIANSREQAMLLQKAEQIQLQSQINPHFLYNSFYSIKFMAHNEDYEQIEALVTALAKYYRFLNKETEDTVTLSTEASHMQNYIEVQQMRFGDKITVDVEPVPKEVADFRVPKLILQPVIENAYNYGLKNMLSGGHMSVRYQMNENFLYVEIEDNGGSLDSGKLELLRQQIHTYEGDAVNHAMTNIQRRLMLAYGEACGITLELGSDNGLKVILKMDTNITL